MIVYVYIRVVGQLYINVSVEAPINISRKRYQVLRKMKVEIYLTIVRYW